MAITLQPEQLRRTYDPATLMLSSGKDEAPSKAIIGQDRAINEKIEGFFDICCTKGLTGTQGVLIPQRNRKHLMLKDEVVEAVREGKFHLWAVNTIGEGIEVLTGMPAGKTLEATPGFEEGSVFAKVNERLKEISEILKEERLTNRPVVNPRQMRRIMHMRRKTGDGKRKMRRI